MREVGVGFVACNETLEGCVSRFHAKKWED